MRSGNEATDVARGGPERSDRPPRRTVTAVGFALPARASGDAEAIARKREATLNAKATILVVDDEPDVREVLEEYLAKHGYATMGAANADAAKAVVAKAAIDLALVDVTMPGEDGLALARHLRERHASVAVVFVTSASTVVDRIVGLEMGGDDYISKPSIRARCSRACEACCAGCRPRTARNSAPSACASGAACSTSPRTG